MQSLWFPFSSSKHRYFSASWSDTIGERLYSYIIHYFVFESTVNDGINMSVMNAKALSITRYQDDIYCILSTTWSQSAARQWLNGQRAWLAMDKRKFKTGKAQIIFVSWGWYHSFLYLRVWGRMKVWRQWLSKRVNTREYLSCARGSY